MRSKLTIGATAAVVLCLVAGVVYAGWMHDISECSKAWHARVDNTCTPPECDHDAWVDEMLAAGTEEDNCIAQAVGVVFGNAQTFKFQFFPGGQLPVAVVYSLDNSYGSAPTFLTVENGTLADGSRFSDASIKINGVEVAGYNDFHGSDGFSKPVDLQPGSNTIEFRCSPSEKGGIYVILDDDEYQTE